VLGGAETVTDWCLCETNEAPADDPPAPRFPTYSSVAPSYFRKKVLRSALAFAGWKR